MMAALATCSASTPLRAQIVRGVVVEEGLEAPVEGAMVILLDLEGQTVDQVLTNADGQFIADADHPGPHFIRVDRIGYESLTTERFDVPVNGIFKTVAVPIRPVELVGIKVEGSRRCEVRPEEGRTTARVWEEARKALQAASWTQSSGAYRYTLLQFSRELESDGRTLVKEERRFERLRGQAPYVSAPARELVDSGFIRENPDRTFTYFAPDADAFLSDAFLDTHCMRLERVEDGLIGLGFEPVRGRRVADIRGTLWIDAATAQLDRLEFRYENLPRGRDVGDPRGEVVFGRMPNGTWIVRDWHIRMPILAWAGVQRQRVVRIGYLEEGGVVWRVIDREGTTVIESATASVAGMVRDSLGAAPVAGATVRAPEGDMGGGATARTGAAGSFLLPGLAPGHHVLEVTHASLDTLHLEPARLTVEALAGEVVSVSVRLPGPGEVLRAGCGEPADAAEPGAVLFGRVRRGNAPASGEPVRIQWMTERRRGFEASARAAPPRVTDAPGVGPMWSRPDEGSRWLETTLDDRGVFMFCDVPPGSQLRVEAGAAGSSQTRTIRIPGNAVVVPVTIVLGTG
jgi:hypothetical protein